MNADPSAAPIEAVRQFSRFYTRRIGLLHEGLLGSELSLTEGRIIYELGSRKMATAAVLATELDLDQGYLSRILRGFEERGLITRQPSKDDARQQIVSLTDAGVALFIAIDGRSRDEIGGLLNRLSPADRKRLVTALTTSVDLLGGTQADPRRPFILRSPEPGDIGWVVHRHGALYAAEYGWDWTFEAMVAEIAARFIENFDAARERCWIAERDGAIQGAVFVVRNSDTVGRLRMLYVEPSARGAGLGRTLVRACIRFAGSAGYRKITLWTNDVLTAARAIYRSEGFVVTEAQPEHHFGKDLVSETWERELA
jgi:DNA-binding MarR family transcriptional regulator/N-acetylglutamate synthase-like GNAT family acetyltransferase